MESGVLHRLPLEGVPRVLDRCWTTCVVASCFFTSSKRDAFQRIGRLLCSAALLLLIDVGDLSKRAMIDGRFLRACLTVCSARFYTAEIALGLGYLHKHGVIYRFGVWMKFCVHRSSRVEVRILCCAGT